MTSFRIIGLVSIAFGSAASAATLPLLAGDYGAVGVPCDAQANATIVSFDGKNFAYPHATACHDAVTHQSAKAFAIRETCGAIGDGSRAGSPPELFRIRVDAADRFEAWHGNHHGEFRRCGALGFFDKR